MSRNWMVEVKPWEFWSSCTQCHIMVQVMLWVKYVGVKDLETKYALYNDKNWKVKKEYLLKIQAMKIELPSQKQALVCESCLQE